MRESVGKTKNRRKMNRALIALIALLAYFFETAPLLSGFGPGGSKVLVEAANSTASMRM
jgi:hypothetical protein